MSGRLRLDSKLPHPSDWNLYVYDFRLNITKFSAKQCRSASGVLRKCLNLGAERRRYRGCGAQLSRLNSPTATNRRLLNSIAPPHRASVVVRRAHKWTGLQRGVTEDALNHVDGHVPGNRPGTLRLRPDDQHLISTSAPEALPAALRAPSSASGATAFTSILFRMNRSFFEHRFYLKSVSKKNRSRRIGNCSRPHSLSRAKSAFAGCFE